MSDLLRSTLYFLLSYASEESGKTNVRSPAVYSLLSTLLRNLPMRLN